MNKRENISSDCECFNSTQILDMLCDYPEMNEMDKPAESFSL